MEGTFWRNPIPKGRVPTRLKFQATRPVVVTDAGVPSLSMSGFPVTLSWDGLLNLSTLHLDLRDIKGTLDERRLTIEVIRQRMAEFGLQEITP